MNSRERHEARFRRRAAMRQARRDAYSKSFGDYEEVFSYAHLYEAGKKCCKGVMWKNSTQSYAARMPNCVYVLDNGTFGLCEFDIAEGVSIEGVVYNLPGHNISAEDEVDFEFVESGAYIMQKKY